MHISRLFMLNECLETNTLYNNDMYNCNNRRNRFLYRLSTSTSHGRLIYV